MNRISRLLDEPGVRRHLVILVGLAALERMLYFLRYSDLPFAYGPICDSIVYLDQAHQILAGRFGHEALLAFSPLYGYFLVLAGGGASFLAPILAQFALGCLGVALMYLVGRRLAGARAGLFSAGIYLAYGMFPFLESKILSEPLALFLVLAASALFLSERFRAGGLGAGILAGGLVGLSVLARASLVFSAPLFVLVSLLPWSRPREPLRVLVSRTLALAIGLALTLGGNGLWNLANAGRFVPVILVSGSAASASATPWTGSLDAVKQGSTATADSFDVVRQAGLRLGSAPDRAVAGGGAAFGIDLAGWARNTPVKLAEGLADRETMYQYSYDGERSELWPLRILPASFGLVAFLGALGAIALALRRGARSLLPYAPYVAGCIVTISLYYPESRYRIAMTIPLILLGGQGLAALTGIAGSRRRAALLAAVALVCAFFAVRTIAAPDPAPAIWPLHLAASATAMGDKASARRYLAQADRLAPSDPRIQFEIRRLSEGLAEPSAGTPAP